jgi:hypothetical protein
MTMLTKSGTNVSLLVTVLVNRYQSSDGNIDNDVCLIMLLAASCLSPQVHPKNGTDLFFTKTDQPGSCPV